MRHFKDDRGPQAVTCQLVWAFRLHGSYLINVVGRHVLDASLRLEDWANMTVRFREQPDDGDSGYFIEFHPRNNEVIFGNPYYIFRRQMELNQGTPIKLQAFVRGSLIECFVNDTQGFTIRAYDHLDGDLTFTVDHGMGWIEAMKVKLP